LLVPVLEIAKSAGRGIMSIYDRGAIGGGPGEIETVLKDDSSPLTEADLLSHRIIAEACARLAPEIPLVSEEDPASLAHRSPVGRFWLIDPMDGTREFLARNGEFTVNIALIERGVPVLGVVGAPALGLLYWGGVGLGAFRERAGEVEPIGVAPRGPGPVRVVASRSHMNADTARFVAAIGEHELVRAGSSLKFCRIAEGAADCYPRLAPTCEWDTAAAQAVLEAAGGRVCTLAGAPLRYGKPDVRNPSFVATALAPSDLPQMS
jgi:3'(2'), 5'-bisphosphate nucleotidase